VLAFGRTLPQQIVEIEAPRRPGNTDKATVGPKATGAPLCGDFTGIVSIGEDDDLTHLRGEIERDEA
jgi:hypothetical protein